MTRASLPGMNEQQQRALWSVALHTLADGIARGEAQIPTSIDLHSHDLDYVALLEHADLSTPKVLPVKILSTCAAIQIPTGQRLDLPITWALYASLPEDGDERQFQLTQYEAHNNTCVQSSEVPA